MVVRKSSKRRYQPAAWLGGGVFVLAVIGFITILTLIGSFVGNVIESTRKETKFERFITPVVMQDPPSFDDPAKLSNQILLGSSVWSILLSGDTSHYVIDDYDRLVIPASDVEVACSRLFGSEVTLEHASFGNIEAPFLYDGQENKYYIPVTGQSNVYTPKVESMEREGNLYYLHVGYIPPTYGWSMNLEGEKFEPQAQKYMLYTVEDTDQGWRILSVSALEGTQSNGVLSTESQEELAGEDVKA